MKFISVAAFAAVVSANHNGVVTAGSTFSSPSWIAKAKTAFFRNPNHNNDAPLISSTAKLLSLLETRGGSTEAPKKKWSDEIPSSLPSKRKKKSEEDLIPVETVDAAELYLPGLLDAVITKTNKV